MCGKLVGIGDGALDGFFRQSCLNIANANIEQNYRALHNYGQTGSRQHIWSLALGHTQ